MRKNRVAIVAVALILIGAAALAATQEADDGDADAANAISGSDRQPERETTAPTLVVEPPATTVPRWSPRRVSLAFTGDIIPHGSVVERARTNATSGYDFSPMFARVAPIIDRADLALCHLETPLGNSDADISGYPTFNAPPALATAIAEAGFDGCSTASNHSMDRGADGVDATIEVMNSEQLGHAGTARVDRTGREAKRYSVRGIDIAHLSFTYGLNGFVLPADRPWLVGLIEPEEIEAEASAARAAGAEFIVLSLHWGAEYQSAPTAEQLALADRLAAYPDIDLIIGHHAHVIQPVTEIAGTPVVFGLGNLLSNQSSECCVAASQDGVIVQVALTERRSGGFRTDVSFVPTWVDRSDYVIMPAAEYLDEKPDSSLAEPLRDSWSRTVSTMTSMGADVSPVGTMAD